MTDRQKGKPWSREYLEAEQTRNALQNAERSILAAVQTTPDSAIAYLCNRALLEIRPAARLAQELFDRQRLKWAEHQELLEDAAEGGAVQ